MRPAAEPTAAAARPAWLRGPWLAVVLGVVCFLTSLPNGFTYDDRPMVRDNPRIRSLTDFHSIWLSDWWQTADIAREQARDRLYRPLTMYSFALDYALAADNALLFHATNLLLHALACGLVWGFARRLVGDDATASIAAVLFAVHPVHVEAVANVVGRAEVLSTILLLTGLIALMPRSGPPGAGRGSLAALAFFAALLAKETAVCYPGLALLVLYATRRGKLGRRWLVHGGLLLLPLLVYLPLRYHVMEGQLLRALPAAVLNPLADAGGAARVLGAFTVLGHYVRLLLVPQWLSADYGLAIINPARGLTVWTGIGVVATGTMLVGLWGFRRPRGGPWRLVAVLTALFLVSYALISNTVLLVGVSLAERLMYWPSVPALLLVAVGVRAFWQQQLAPGRPLAPRAGLVSVLGILVIAALGLRSGLRSLDWRDNITLFTRDAGTIGIGAHLNHLCGGALLHLYQTQTPPEPADRTQWAVARDHLAALGLWRPDWSDDYKRAALLEAARRHLNRSLEIYPPNAAALAARGRVRLLLGDVGGARTDLESALLIQPRNAQARADLARLAATDGAFDEQLAALQQRVTTAPADAAAHLAYGRALLAAGRPADAVAELRRATELAPRDADAWRALGEARAVLRHDDQAVAAFQQAIKIAPDDWAAHANLSLLLAERDPAASLDHARRAFALQPDDLRCAMNLAEALAINGYRDQALGLFRDIMQQLAADDPLRHMVRDKIRRLERDAP